MTHSEKIAIAKNDKKYGALNWHYAEDCNDGLCTKTHHHGVNCRCVDCIAEFDN